MNNKNFHIDNSGIDPQTNFSDNPEFQQVLASRRSFLKGSLGAAIATIMGTTLAGCDTDSADPVKLPEAQLPEPAPVLLGFTALAAARPDTILVPQGYTARAFLPMGTPLLGSYPAYKNGGQNTGAEMEQQVGAHHDGMHFFPLDARSTHQNSAEGLLVFNHEYLDPDLLHPNGATGLPRPADEVRKEVAVHGVTVAHIKKDASGEFQLVQGSPLNRRITGATPMELTGPVRGHQKVITKYSQDGTRTRGTLNNCGNGFTPWGTYLTCEENWAGYFMNADATQPREHSRYGVGKTASRYYWETADNGADQYQRFNATTMAADASADYRNEPNTFGWIVEIDPFNPDSVPQKRTALGRFGHEGVIFGPVTEGQPVTLYSGDDSQFEYIYKYVSNAPYYKATAGGHLLNDGTLYAAKFNADGSGEWLALDINNTALQSAAAAAGVVFDSQADVLLNTRLAADLAGATKMDRPEWGAVHPATGEVYFTLTNNTRRTAAQIDPANPRANNATGHIIRWKESSSSVRNFSWDIFLLAGDVGTNTPGTNITLTADNHMASPDGLCFDANGLLWIQTDMSGSQQGEGPFGNNQMLVANPATKEIKRFLVGPMDAEITGLAFTPDGKTMFVNIQHPGDRSTPTNLTSHWPANDGTSHPRSATVIVTKDDGGLIGS
ncbi:PhoX family phosphatase [Rheinheimera sp.]|uniref:PhoX family protein n=1 Tax=Rheinheimera sp. TaxID=1869214 RepID=UPI00307DDB53